MGAAFGPEASMFGWVEALVALRRDAPEDP
jgi:hypothetical protein